MNLLTGKAYEDFRKWINNSLLNQHGIGCGCGAVFNIEDYSEYIQLSIIKEWFETEGIVINDFCLHNIGNQKCGFDIDTKGIGHSGDGAKHKTRTGALKEAISVANKLYNQKDTF